MKAAYTFSAALIIALSTSCAFAAPVLRADISVVSPIVTVGDMFDDAGTLAEQPMFRAPRPGTTGTVDIDTIRAAAARAGFSEFASNGLSAVRVSRSAALVDETLLSSLISNDLRARGILSHGMQAQTMFASPVGTIEAAATDQPARLDGLRYLPGNSTFTARFILAGVDQPLTVSGTIDLMVDVPQLATSLPAGAILSEADIVMRPVSVRQAYAQGIPRLDQLVGMSLNRQSREGMTLRISDVSTPLTINKNDPVTIYFRQGPLTLTVKGQAITGASEGAPLQVLNLMSKRVISATAVAPGAVEVSTSGLTVAGL